jgi:PAS domain S-box-containing protein
MFDTEEMPVKRNSLLFFTIVFVALCAFLFNSFYSEAKKTAIRKLNEEQMLHAKQAARGIEEFFTTWNGVLTSFSRMDEIIAVDADGKKDMDFFYEAHKEQLRAITRLDEKGTILYTAPSSHVIGINISHQRHMRKILNYHTPVVSDVFKTVQGFDAVAVHVPVFKGSDFKGTIAFVVNFENLAKRYLDVIKIGETGYAWVVSRDGTVLYSPIPGFTGKSVFENYKDFPSIIAMAEDMLKGNQGITTYTFGRVGESKGASVRKHAVYLPIHIGDTFWSIVVESSENEVLSSLTSFRNRLLLVIGMILLGGGLFSVISVKAWLIVREEKKRKRAEDELRASEQRYRHLFEHNPAPILIYQRGTMKMLAVNDAFIHHYGYSREEALNLLLTDLYPEEEKKPITEMVTGFKGLAYPGEWHHRKADGSFITIVARSHDIDYWGYDARIAVISDITELKLAEEELRNLNATLDQKVRERTTELESLLGDMTEAKQALETANEKLEELDRLKSLFIASMSHELRTPLNSIIGFTGILLQGLAGPLNDEQRKQLGMVKGSSRHLLELITDIIDLSKIEAGKISLSMDSFDLAKTVRETLETFRVAAGRKALSLALEGPEQLMVRSDIRRVRQVLVNLIGNAVKFTERGGYPSTWPRTMARP